MASSRGHGSRPRSASLKALPPDGVGTEAPSVSAAAAHWTVKEKASASAGSASGQRHRPLKSVSLKLGKGCDASPTSSSRSNSAGGQGWGSGELFIDSRRSASQATGSSCGSGPPSRESTAREASQHLAYPPHGGGAVSRAPLQPLQPGQPAVGGGREKLLSSTAPAAVGRPPPAPARSALGSAAAGEAPPSSAGDRRRGAGAALRSPDIASHGRGEIDSSRGSPDISSQSGGSRSSRPGRGSPKSGENDALLNQDDLPSRPGSSYERAAATYAALPKTPGAARTLLQDADGFIFRPAVEAEVKPMPRGLRRGQQPQPQLAKPKSGSPNLAAALFTGAPAVEASAGTSAGEGRRAALPASLQGYREQASAGTSAGEGRRAALPASLQGYREQVLQLQAKAQLLRQEVLQEAPRPPEAPRIAWSDGPGSAGEDEADEEDTLELAQQIRRDFLSRQVMREDKDDEDDPGDAVPEGGQAEARQPEATTADSWVFRTDDARRSMANLEASLAKAKERADRDRLELGGYLDGLRSKTFQVEADASANTAEEEELLVSMPPDFEDVVDINASLAAADRRSRGRAKKEEESRTSAQPGATASTSSTARSARGSSSEKDGFRMPSFLEKYFLEDKAEQLPIVRLQQEEDRVANAPREMSELERGLRQIAKLDSLLSSREAVGAAKLKAARQELDVTKERLRRESESSEQEKIEVLRQLKEKGMLRSSAPSCASVGSSRAPSEPSHSVLNSARGSTTSLVPAMPTSPANGGSSVDWSGWACSVVEAEPAPRDAALQLLQRQPPQDAGATADRQDKAEEEEELDTGTFSLTSERANLGSLGSMGAAKTGSRHMPTKLLEPVIEAEDTLAATTEDLGSEDGEEIELDAPPLALQDDDYAADPYDLDAIRSIDEKLAKLVPEAEWEAKSIHSLPMGQDSSSTAAGEEAGGARSSKARSIWSYRSSSGKTLPGDPTLREQLEEREAQAALYSIDEKLQELQDLEQQSARGLGTTAPVLSPEELQKLLMQAAAQSALPHAEDKVLALTAQADDLQLSLKNFQQQRPSGSASTALALFEPSRAREILTNLADQMEDWDTAFAEAKFSLDQVEDGLRALEEESAAKEQAALPESEDPAIHEAVAAVSQIASRLEELGREATTIAERSLESEAIVPTILEDEPGDLGPALPQLTGAAEEEEDDDDLGSFLADDDLGVVPEPEESAEPEPSLEVRGRLGPSEELRKALELDLPVGDGLWSDADLERLSTAMDAHFGDVPAAVPEVHANLREEQAPAEREEADVVDQ
eukprot:TRINITY_DN29428_c0_g3_i1.p1 TRINITY_DN29428_c0_g3~~TRINITY_DN29428_c0_g3_i1.p1  ORF type:complete len:1288 (+),score=336.76 TRINITY_DN29428_c0_g3_i1:47-3910(+)